MHRALVGGHLQRVVVAHIAGREVAVLKVRLPPSPARAPHASPAPEPAAPDDHGGTNGPVSRTSGESVYLVLVAGDGLGMLDPEARALVRGAMQGASSPSQARWRARVEGGRLAAVAEDGVAVVRDGETWRAIAAAGRRDLELEPSNATLAGMPEPTREALTVRASRVFAELVQSTLGTRREALRRALAKATARVDRRVEAIRGDLDRIEGAESRAELARMFVAEAARAPRGAKRLVAVDWSSGEARSVEMPLDPGRTAKEQVDALFKRARRLKDGRRIAGDRLTEAEGTRDALRAAAASLHADDADLATVEQQARLAAPRDFKLTPSDSPSGRARPAARGGAAGPRPPYRVFLGGAGPRILVGRGAAHNDALTFHVARPHDLWLHAKSRAGAHVVVPLEKGGSCPADLLVEAAHLAAYFSEARDENLVEVQYTLRRYVRKPRGSEPGRVMVDREKVLVLRRRADLLTELLEREVLH